MTNPRIIAEPVNAEPLAPEPGPIKHRPQAAWRERNPLKVWAHKAFEAGLRRGLIESKPCEICGEPKTDGHHSDYAKPLEVRWLCRAHHKAAHATGRAKA